MRVLVTWGSRRGGTWLPLALILGAIWLTGEIMSMMPEASAKAGPA